MLDIPTNPQLFLHLQKENEYLHETIDAYDKELASAYLVLNRIVDYQEDLLADTSHTIKSQIKKDIGPDTLYKHHLSIQKEIRE